MRQSYSINEILNAVSDIKPKRGRPKKNSSSKILKENQNKLKRPLLLTNIIKHEPKNKKLLFLKKLYNTNIKIITVKAPKINK
jgi:hypothetical protein